MPLLILPYFRHCHFDISFIFQPPRRLCHAHCRLRIAIDCFLARLWFSDVWLTPPRFGNTLSFSRYQYWLRQIEKAIICQYCRAMPPFSAAASFQLLLILRWCHFRQRHYASDIATLSFAIGDSYAANRADAIDAATAAADGWIAPCRWLRWLRRHRYCQYLADSYCFITT